MTFLRDQGSDDKGAVVPAQILRRTVENIRSVISYNKIEGNEVGAGKVQRGGTATIMREELTAYVTKSGVDPSGLGRW